MPGTPSDNATTTVDELVVTADPARKPGLQQASWRGVPFAVLTADGTFGRRVAIHEYPYRDKPYVEDLGRGMRRIAIQGFLITNSRVYGGGDVIAQREKMIAAAEAEGTGLLVHPTLGVLRVSLPNVVINERWDFGRYFELRFEFIESGSATFPTLASATKNATAGASANANMAAASDFGVAFGPLLPLGGLTVETAIGSVGAWGARVAAAGSDASGLVGLASQLTGPYGRFFNGGNAGFIGGAVPQTLPAGTSIEDLALGAAASRAALSVAIANVALLAAELGLPGALAADLAAAVQAEIAALAATCADPADALRLLSSLTTFVEPSVAAVAGPIGDLFRRAVVTALAQIAAAYNPTSYDDAVAVRSLVTEALDDEIIVAGDAGEDASFGALRALRAAAVQDLATRGAALAPLADFVLGDSLPSLVVAQRLYRDATRADELVTEASPANPLFMPPSFRALAA